MYYFLAYFSQREYNIITIEYTSIASSLNCYNEAISNFSIIAKCIAQFLYAVLNEYDQFKYVHAIGFSLGSQVIGLVGKLLNTMGNKTLDRATGKNIYRYP